MEDERVIEALYEGILKRAADSGGRQTYVLALRDGKPLADIVSDLLGSDEYRRKSAAIAPSRVLPDLTKLIPDKYVRTESDSVIFKASSVKDFDLLEDLIARHRYYDSLGVWTPKIDLDKRITAAIVGGLGARSCLELGCFSGSVLSVLQSQGVDVCGVELSHLAFVLAHDNIHQNLRFGDLLDLNFSEQFDVVLAMDILEHLNPTKLDRYIAKINALMQPNGFVYVNSPMFGTDDTFGSPFKSYVPEWRDEGDNVFWHHLHCDAQGWPMHGHLIWASPQWWEAAFASGGLVRDRRIEATIHGCLADFFDSYAPARKSFFVLRTPTPGFQPEYDALTAALTENICHTLQSATVSERPLRGAQPS